MVTLKIFDNPQAHRMAIDELLRRGIRFSSWTERIQAQKIGPGPAQVLNGLYAILVDDDF